MKKAFLATVLGVSLSAVWAVDWDADDDFTMLADDGTVVGQGKLDDDGLELELVSGYTGFVRFDAGGEMVEGIVNADGTITLYNTDGFAELDDDLSSKGYSLVVTPVDSIAAPAGIVVTPTDPNRDDDMEDDGNDDNSSGTGSSDDDDDSHDDNGSDDNRSSADGSAGSDDASDDNTGSSSNNDTSSEDDDNDDSSDDSSGSNTTSSDDNGGDDD